MCIRDSLPRLASSVELVQASPECRGAVPTTHLPSRSRSGDRLERPGSVLHLPKSPEPRTSESPLICPSPSRSDVHSPAERAVGTCKPGEVHVRTTHASGYWVTGWGVTKISDTNPRWDTRLASQADSQRAQLPRRRRG